MGHWHLPFLRLRSLTTALLPSEFTNPWCSQRDHQPPLKPPAPNLSLGFLNPMWTFSSSSGIAPSQQDLPKRNFSWSCNTEALPSSLRPQVHLSSATRQIPLAFTDMVPFTVPLMKLEPRDFYYIFIVSLNKWILNTESKIWKKPKKLLKASIQKQVARQWLKISYILFGTKLGKKNRKAYPSSGNRWFFSFYISYLRTDICFMRISHQPCFPQHWFTLLGVQKNPTHFLFMEAAM